jgi:uncharacterized cupin superfamily protein
MPKVDLSKISVKTGSAYPGVLASKMDGRSQQAVGAAGGITQFGANIVNLAPGALSSLRHWHEQQDEILVVLAGELTLVDDNGETVLHPGDCAAFPAGEANGHHLINKSGADGKFFVVGTHIATETGWYSDEDMKVTDDESGFSFTKKDGTPL